MTDEDAKRVIREALNAAADRILVGADLGGTLEVNVALPSGQDYRYRCGWRAPAKLDEAARQRVLAMTAQA